MSEGVMWSKLINHASENARKIKWNDAVPKIPQDAPVRSERFARAMLSIYALAFLLLCTLSALIVQLNQKPSVPTGFGVVSVATQSGLATGGVKTFQFLRENLFQKSVASEIVTVTPTEGELNDYPK